MKTWALLALTLASCGGEAALQGNCGRSVAPDGAALCIDGRATSPAALDAVHEGTCPNAPWSSSSCPRGDRLGGCLTGYIGTPEGGAGQLIFWYYPSATVQTEADVMNRCARFDEMFVPADGGFPPA